MMTSPTSALTKRILAYLKLQGCFVHRQNVGRVPGRAVPKDQQGVPDIIGLSAIGRFIGVALKAGKDGLRESQKLYRELVLARGGIYIYCYSFDEFIEKWGKI